MRKLVDSRDNIVQFATDTIIKTYWEQETRVLPKVCEAGKACRDTVFNKAKEDIEALWKQSVDDIALIFRSGMQRTSWYGQSALIDAELCESGCHSTGSCPDDANERHLILHSRQQPRSAKIVDLLKQYDELLSQQALIFETCPDYENRMYMMDSKQTTVNY